MANYNLIDSRNSNDSVMGTENNDSIKVYGNFTTVDASAGDDIVSLNGGKHDGSIWLEGEEENIVYGGTGNDTIKVYSRGASVFGDAGNDTVNINRGHVYANGGAGNDYFDAIGSDNVTITGGEGKDTVEIYPSTQYENIGIAITDFSNEDILSVNEYYSYLSYEKSRESHRVITQRVENGNIVISDNSSLTTSYNGDTIVESVEPYFNITLQGVSDINQVIDAQYRIYGYYAGDNPLVEHGTLGELFGIEKTATETVAPVDTVDTVKTSQTEDTVPAETIAPVDTTDKEKSTALKVGQIFEMDGKYYKVTADGYELVGTSVNDTATTKGDTVINVTNNTNTTINNITNVTNNTTVNNINETVNNNVTVNNINETVNNVNVVNNNFSYTYVYNGGNRVINNYAEGELINLGDFAGINLDANNFYVMSSSGALEVQNVRGKFVDYSYGGETPIAYSYLGNESGVIDGRSKGGRLGVMIGANYLDNQIYAGNSGSTLWGGMGGNDVLTGGAGYDEFFYAPGSGSDVIKNADSNDVVNLLGVNLSQITYASVTDSEISADFADGGHLNVKSSAAVGFKLEGVTYVANRSNGTWSTK